jgi:phage terminase large subunit-like protein
VGKSLKRQLAEMPHDKRVALLADLDLDTLQQMDREEWWFVQRPEQVPPPGEWTVHLYLAGRGCGKTRSGAEWLVQRAIDYPRDSSGFPTERLVVAYNLSDTRIVCIEGASGVLRVLQRRGFREVKDYYTGDKTDTYHYTKSPKPHITLLETGTKIHFTGADPDAPRGFNLADVWMDEPVKWEDPLAVWKEGIFPALRADLPGDKPRAFVTTTPKPIELLQHWLRQDDGTISMARGSTFDNADNLSTDFLNEARKMYEGTALGRQELYGEMLDSIEGMLFTYAAIHNHRVTIGPLHVAHRTVGVDPGLTGADEGDEMGVVVACRDAEDHMYIVADETTRLAGRDAALHAWRVYEKYQCDTLVYESNLGKAWMHEVFVDAFRELQRAGVFPAEVVEPPVVAAFSTQGKKLRAEPVAMRYSQGRVHHIGSFEKLESQMLGFDPVTSKVSPDRLDALVHACRHLIDGEKRRSKILSPANYPIPSLGGTPW